MDEERLTPDSKKIIKDILDMGIAQALRRVQADHIFNLENEVKKLYSLFYTIKQETVNKEYVLEKISQLLHKKPLSMSYEPTVLAYCLIRELINHCEKDQNIISICEQAIKEEKLINFEPFDKINLTLEDNKNENAQ